MVISQCWRSYNMLADKGYHHSSITSISMRRKMTLTWNPIIMERHEMWFKRKGYKGLQGRFESYLTEYMWRQFHDRFKKFSLFLTEIATMYICPRQWTSEVNSFSGIYPRWSILWVLGRYPRCDIPVPCSSGCINNSMRHVCFWWLDLFVGAINSFNILRKIPKSFRWPIHVWGNCAKSSKEFL